MQNLFGKFVAFLAKVKKIRRKLHIDNYCMDCLQNFMVILCQVIDYAVNWNKLAGTVATKALPKLYY